MRRHQTPSRSASDSDASIFELPNRRPGNSCQRRRDARASGVQCFMAHEHIEVSVEWRNEILRQLGLADLFVPILSQQYYTSIWCKQESGIAAFRGMTLIPLSLDGSIPQGFIGHVQSTMLQGGQATYHQLMRG